MTRTIAVTGGSGFLGAAIIRLLLENGDKVKALARRPGSLRLPEADNLEVVEGSLEEADSLARLAEGADALVNSAGLTHARSDEEFREVNARGAGNAATAALNAGAYFLHVSSIAARRPELSAYAQSKRDGETAVQSASGQRWVALRAPAIYGPGDRATLPYFKLVRSGLAPEPAQHPEPRASILYVEDVAVAVASVLDDPPPAGIYDIGDEQCDGRSWREIGATLAATLNVTARRIRAPQPVLAGYAGLSSAIARATGRAPMITPGKIREFFHSDWVARENLLSAATGWRPRTPLNEGFAKTVRWYQEHGWL